MTQKAKTTWALKLEELFGIDLRSLALFRVGLALLIISDLILRSLDLKAHYTDFGVLPRIDFLRLASDSSWRISLHLISGSTFFQTFLFLIAAIFAILLLLGYRTRLVTFVSWLLLISLQSRNPALLQGGDILLRLFLFWSLFLPMGACYSIDRALNNSPKKPPDRIMSVGTVALLMQVCFVYWFTVVLKTGETWKDGSAIYYALSIDQFATPLGRFLLGYPRLLEFLTHSTVYFEMLGPFFAFVPIWSGFLRTATVFFFILFHIGMGLCLELGPFPYVSSVGWLVFLPRWFWDKIFHRLRTPQREGVKIYYDGDCSFCKKMVLILKVFFLLPPTPVLPAQEEPSIFSSMQEENSWVVVDSQEKRHFRFQGWIAICRASPLLWPFAPFFAWRPVKAIGEKIYDRMARHRGEEAKLFSWLSFRPLKVETKSWMNLLAAFFFLYIILWNFHGFYTTPFSKSFFLKLDWVGSLFRLNQKWRMFAPDPRKEDGWYVIPGRLRNGKEVDLLNPKSPLDWRKPPGASAFFPNERWRKYMMNIWKRRYAPYRKGYARYLCRRWNEDHQGGEALVSLRLYFMQENTPPPYSSPPTPQKRLLLEYDCFIR